MSTLSVIRDALGEALETLPGWNVARYVPDAVTTPQLVIASGGVTYDVTMGRGADELRLVVSAYVSRTAEGDQQALLDELLEPDGVGSLKEAVEAASVSTDAGVHYFRVRSASAPDGQTVGALPYVLMDFEVEVVF